MTIGYRQSWSPRSIPNTHCYDCGKSLENASGYWYDPDFLTGNPLHLISAYFCQGCGDPRFKNRKEPIGASSAPRRKLSLKL